MEQDTKICPKCGGVMELGYIKPLNHVPMAFFGAMVGNQRWYQVSEAADVKHGKKVLTFSCMQCGYLESFLESQK